MISLLVGSAMAWNTSLLIAKVKHFGCANIGNHLVAYIFLQYFFSKKKFATITGLSESFEVLQSGCAKNDS
jgi:hypothetical protein